jgi:Flp pilus assembly pilin Flp
VQLIAFAITSLFARLRSSERGQDLLEYALLGGLIAAALMGVLAASILTGSTGAVEKMATNIGHCIDFAKSTTCGPF